MRRKDALLGVADLAGLWRRSLIAWPDGRRDTTTEVRWLQGQRAFGDLRRPTPMADFSHAAGLSELTRQDCARLAQQQAFAGYLTFDGRHFEWTRLIDYQPPGLFPDAGSLHWEGEVLIEQGRDVDYTEYWHRDPVTEQQPAAALMLRDMLSGTPALLLKVGNDFVFARGRAAPLPPFASLRECVAAATTVEEARTLVDCEISFGSAACGRFRITGSTLPYRVGQLLQAGVARDWTLLDSEGDASAISGLRAACA
jgi:hypothetical protein